MTLVSSQPSILAITNETRQSLVYVHRRYLDCLLYPLHPSYLRLMLTIGYLTYTGHWTLDTVNSQSKTSPSDRHLVIRERTYARG